MKIIHFVKAAAVDSWSFWVKMLILSMDFGVRGQLQQSWTSVAEPGWQPCPGLCLGYIFVVSFLVTALAPHFRLKVKQTRLIYKNKWTAPGSFRIQMSNSTTFHEVLQCELHLCLQYSQFSFHCNIDIKTSIFYCRETRHANPSVYYNNPQPCPSSLSLSTASSCFPHHLLVLNRQLCQFTSQPLMEVQVFGHTAVQANRLPLCQLCFFIMRRYTLPVAGIGHSERKNKGQGSDYWSTF